MSLKVYGFLIFLFIIINFPFFDYLTYHFSNSNIIEAKFLTFWYFVGFILVIFTICLLFISYLKKTTILGCIGTTLMMNVNIFMFFLFDPSHPLVPYHPITLLNVPIVYIPLLSLLPFLLLIIIFSLLYFLYKKSPKPMEESLIRKMIIDSGTNFTRMSVKEISEKIGIDLTSIISIVKKMIDNEEISAVYFNSTKSIAYNQQLNIDKFDDLMLKYNQWEKNNIGKI